ncbi:alpha/beta hydrolase [Nonomuraea sp. NPDC050310]|uniref:alpha/beta hydrolase n=1 Tax=Nonomuraea sp. NPDC050310 TaxID=3154935 RepID=UPI0033D30FE3
MNLHPHVLVSADGTVRQAAELGRLDVPENRADPASRRIEVAFARLRGGDGPPMIFLEGGPGESGTRIWERAPERYEPYREFGDVVLLDQRGLGLSRPRLTSPHRLDLPLDRLVGREEHLAAVLDLAERTARFWRERGVEPAAYTTAESADDVAEVMTALGYDRFRTFGGSYGSHLSLAVLRRHGHRVERAVMFGVEGPGDTYKLPSDTDRHLAGVAALAAARGVTPDLIGLMRRVFARLPVSFDGVVIGEFDVKMITAANLGSRRFIRRLPELYLAAERGDHTFWAEQTRALRTAESANLMATAMDCASGASAERWERIRKEAPDSLLGDAMNLPFPLVCPAIGAGDAGEDFRAPLRSEVPALLLCGSLDGRTPPANALAVLDGLPHGHFILVRHATHEFLPALPGVREAVAEFLTGGRPTLREVTIPFEFGDEPSANL